MLLQFTVENFRSIREPLVFSMLASEHVDHRRGGVYEVPGVGDVLKVAAIYGANASGKSSLVDAWRALARLVSKGIEPDQRIPYEPFKLDPTSKTRPTQLEVHFLIDAMRWVYRIEFNSARVLSEQLSQFSTVGGMQSVFRRVAGEGKVPGVTWGAALPVSEERRAFYGHIGAGTRHEQPLMAELRTRNAHELDDVYGYFRWSDFDVDPGHWGAGLPLTGLIHTAAVDVSIRSTMEAFLRGFGTGVEGILFKSDQPEQDVRLNGGEVVEQQEAVRLLNEHSLRLVFQHRGGILEHSELSAGTQRLLGLSWHFATHNVVRAPLVIDELDRSFHTALTQEIVAHALEHLCVDGVQLVFTTHDTNLLDAALLGADGIWFIEKDHDGASHAFSLAEFDPEQLVDLDGALERGYLDGRFGAIPFGQHRPSLNLKGTAL